MKATKPAGSPPATVKVTVYTPMDSLVDEAMPVTVAERLVNVSSGVIVIVTRSPVIAPEEDLEFDDETAMVAPGRVVSVMGSRLVEHAVNTSVDRECSSIVVRDTVIVGETVSCNRESRRLVRRERTCEGAIPDATAGHPSLRAA